MSLADPLAAARAALLDHLPKDAILARYQAAGGQELVSGKFANPELSAALVANAFGLFGERPDLLSLPGESLGGGEAQTVALEAQMRFPWSGGLHPWLDVGVQTAERLIGIESKRYEPFRDHKTATFSAAYARPVWGQAMGPYEAMRDALSAGQRFAFLDAAQLVKHAFGLRTEGQRTGRQAVLCYLYAEPRAFPDGRAIPAAAIQGHRDEVASFTADVSSTVADVAFCSLSYAQLLQHWAAQPKLADHAAALAARFDLGADVTRLRVIDLETTGTEPPAEIIEFGRVDVEIGPAGSTVEPPLAWLYRPLRGIPPETMAIHHITDADFGPDTPVCTPEYLHRAVWSGPTPAALVAHSCAFERQFVTEATTGAIPWICTYKVAMHVWPDAPRHSNQVLRYWRNLVLDNALAMPPHRAGPDAWVTAHLLADLAKFATFDQMVAWTNEPRPMPTLTFGKHRGQAWAKVPSDYLDWMLRQTDMDPDTVWHAEQELVRRAR